MPTFIKSGNIFSVSPDNRIDQRPLLPTGTYSLQFSMEAGFYLEETEDVKIGHKVYGSAGKLSDRILSTFQDRKGNTGVLLSGNKGSGKTVLAKMLSIKGVLDQDLPTIYISQPFRGESFNRFLTNITQPAIVVIDEFEKVYAKQEEQESLLSLLDGLYPSKKLFIVTINDTHKLSSFMLNRPGRFFYHIRYKGLSDEEVREFSEDNLRNKDKIEILVKVARGITNISYDILSSIVEELNRYDEDVREVIKLLNIDMTPKYGIYTIKSMVNKKTNLAGVLNRTTLSAMPGVSPFNVLTWASDELKLKDKENDTYDAHGQYIEFEADHLVAVKNGEYIFDNEEWVVSLKAKGGGPTVDVADFAIENAING